MRHTVGEPSQLPSKACRRMADQTLAGLDWDILYVGSCWDIPNKSNRPRYEVYNDEHAPNSKEYVSRHARTSPASTDTRRFPECPLPTAWNSRAGASSSSPARESVSSRRRGIPSARLDTP
jgi:hypothetical protein